MNFNSETFHKFDFTGSQITAHSVWQSQEKLSNLNLEGSFENGQYESCKFWCFWFKHFENQSDTDVTDLTGNRICFLDICLEGDLFLVKMIVGTNRDTDLIAYGGCYWAGPSGVMVGDFSEPLNFNPRLFDISKIVDPDSEGYEIDFKQWQDGQLVVTVEGEEKNISIEEIIKVIKQKLSSHF